MSRHQQTDEDKDHKKSVAFVVDFNSSPTTSSPPIKMAETPTQKKKTVPPLAKKPGKTLKPNPIDELDRVALTGIEELDSDLFDNISYLDLMTKKHDRDERKRREHLENLRRLREGLVLRRQDIPCCEGGAEGLPGCKGGVDSTPYCGCNSGRVTEVDEDSIEEQGLGTSDSSTGEDRMVTVRRDENGDACWELRRKSSLKSRRPSFVSSDLRGTSSSLHHNTVNSHRNSITTSDMTTKVPWRKRIRDYGSQNEDDSASEQDTVSDEYDKYNKWYWDSDSRPILRSKSNSRPLSNSTVPNRPFGRTTVNRRPLSRSTSASRCYSKPSSRYDNSDAFSRLFPSSRPSSRHLSSSRPLSRSSTTISRPSSKHDAERHLNLGLSARRQKSLNGKPRRSVRYLDDYALYIPPPDDTETDEPYITIKTPSRFAEKLSARGQSNTNELESFTNPEPASDATANSDESTDLASDPDGADNKPPPAQAPTPTMAVDPTIRHLWNDAIDLAEVRNVDDQAEFRSLLAQLGIDQISAATLSRYNVRGHMDHYDHPALCYPRYRGSATRNKIPCGLKIIRCLGDKLEKENLPDEDVKPSKFSGIFGYHMITPSDNRVVLTTNERDALAVYDSTNGIPALSLPCGEKLDHSVMSYLEDFDLIYLWFPLIHEKYAKDYASYLNSARCYIITKPERPVELLRDERAGEILKGILEAVRVRYRGFRSLIDIREEVKNEIVQSNSRTVGFATWKRLDALNRYLRGFRPGELTVLTGGTGYGKTTFLCEYSMDLFSQGVRTLFCSFEMPDEKILKWMLVQFAAPAHIRSLARSRTYHNGLKLPLHRIDHHQTVEAWLDKFERSHGEMIIMKTNEFRNKTVSQMADEIQAQVVAAGIQHVVIDNLQFLVGMATLTNEGSTAQDKYNTQDRFIGRLRRMANDLGIHITVVVHTRKITDAEDLELQHIGGSARITQEADNVLAIQRRRDPVDRSRERKFLYILKNRYGGRRVESDRLEMIFQQATYTYSLVDHTKG
ncbi:unnamed protein product [Bursaphelenchus okinawaensis]|uniref:SF4 helicase domain-containing protein n=1 Tax=Bursaphelenchus okinawaensis TaxID=465554 RepID=A0A811LKJ3_9BILA|nr:unnamed protein product [Bursaphelenchus okinawaensis]CAG9123449.1 unnamed protein product [Bursaphelenchus okinawaensis]